MSKAENDNKYRPFEWWSTDDLRTVLASSETITPETRRDMKKEIDFRRTRFIT